MVALPLPSFDSPERRQAEREEVSCQVVLHTSYARMKGMLTDLATGGARFVAELVPGAGVSALLEWDGRETLCRVTLERREVYLGNAEICEVDEALRQRNLGRRLDPDGSQNR